MSSTKEELKSRVEAAVLRSDGNVQFGPELRRDIIEYSKEQQAQGRSQLSVAAELGMKGWTLHRWHQNERKARSGEPAFVEVKPRVAKVAAEVKSPPAFEVRCPSGHEVRVPASFEGRALRELLAALEGH